MNLLRWTLRLDFISSTQFLNKDTKDVLNLTNINQRKQRLVSWLDNTTWNNMKKDYIKKYSSLLPPLIAPAEG